MQKVHVIVGPTASGKSALAVRLARLFGGEVISADSRQVYRGLDIGTGKIASREMRGVRHHLLDVASPKKVFSAQDFQSRARAAITAAARSGHLPIVAGGTGYYVDALLGRIALPAVKPDAALRAKLEKKSVAELYALLKRRDPRRAKMMASKSERGNRRRLIRALEVATALGRVPIGPTHSAYDVLWIGIAPPFAQLEKKIRTRLHSRVRAGMVAEARKLHKTGLSYKRMEELGLEYRSLARYLQGQITKEEMTAELNRDIRRYAKKQLAYWRRNPVIEWFGSSHNVRIVPGVRKWIKK